MKALSVDHKQRYRSMEAFSAALLEKRQTAAPSGGEEDA